MSFGCGAANIGQHSFFWRAKFFPSRKRIVDIVSGNGEIWFALVKPLFRVLPQLAPPRHHLNLMVYRLSASLAVLQAFKHMVEQGVHGGQPMQIWRRNAEMRHVQIEKFGESDIVEQQVRAQVDRGSLYPL